MTAVEIIDKIKRLPRAEQNRVIDFFRNAADDSRLTPEELGSLAEKMVEAKDPAEADRLQAEIVRGFYGGKADGSSTMNFGKFGNSSPRTIPPRRFQL